MRAAPGPAPQEPARTPAEELFSKVRELCLRLEKPASKSEVATMLGVKEPQAQEWLTRLVEEGVLEQLKRPVRYQLVGRAVSQPELFE